MFDLDTSHLMLTGDFTLVPDLAKVATRESVPGEMLLRPWGPGLHVFDLRTEQGHREHGMLDLETATATVYQQLPIAPQSPVVPWSVIDEFENVIFSWTHPAPQLGIPSRDPPPGRHRSGGPPNNHPAGSSWV